MFIEKLFKHVAMTSLLLSILYVALSITSNVIDLKTIENMLSPEVIAASNDSNDAKQRKINLPAKEFHRTIVDYSNVNRLEEVIDMDKYPTVKVVATGYTAGPESTGKSKGHPEYGITYSGIEVQRDLYSTIAADLDVFPLGTILYIPDYGYGVVADIGGAIKGNKVDLFFHTVDDVYAQWGKKELDVYVIERGKGEVTAADLQQLNETEALQVFRDEYR